MELDELKQQWKQADTIQQVNNNDIMEIIRKKDNGPIAALKRSFKMRIAMMIVVANSIIITNMHQLDKTFSSILFWAYILFVIGVVLFARLSYNTAKKMEQMDSTIKANLEQQVALLEKRVRQNLTGIRIALLFFIILLEVAPYLQYFRMLHKWHSLSPLIRFGGYALLLLFQYVVSRQISRRNHDPHIARLKELVEQMR